MGKRGISTIVATVLIVLITVAGIAVTWLWIVPWTQDVEASKDTNANLRIVLEGYTAYDVEHGMAFVQIKRGADVIDVVALDVIFNVEGSSFVFRTQGVPNNNEMETYYFDFAEEEVVGLPQFVKVAPVLSDGVGEKVGLARGEVAIPIKKVSLEDWDEAKIKAEENVMKESVVEDVIIGEAIGSCKSDFVVGEAYSLTEDLNVDGDCFVISVDDVFLNLNGHLVNGSFSGYGVHITSDNVTVRDGKIEGFERGIFIEGLREEDNNTIVNNEFFNNNNSVYIWLSNGNYIGGNRMDSGYSSNIYLRNADDNYIGNNWACGSPNDIYCKDSTGNYGSENSFHTVVNCPNDWLGDSGEDYIEC